MIMLCVRDRSIEIPAYMNYTCNPFMYSKNKCTVSVSVSFSPSLSITIAYSKPFCKHETF